MNARWSAASVQGSAACATGGRWPRTSVWCGGCTSARTVGGTYTFGPVRLEVSDLFAAGVERKELVMPDHYVVSPRSVPVRAADPRARWRVQERPVRGFPEDPALFAGVRPYVPGDPLRSLHWKATARTGQPRSKRFDASREREVMLVLDIQSIPGPYWQTDYDDDLVEIPLRRDGVPGPRHDRVGGTCGFAAAAFTQSLQLEVRILPGGGTRQLLRLDETLARLSSFAAAPFEVLLGRLPRWVPQQTELVTISARDPLPRGDDATPAGHGLPGPSRGHRARRGPRGRGAGARADPGAGRSSPAGLEERGCA